MLHIRYIPKKEEEETCLYIKTVLFFFRGKFIFVDYESNSVSDEEGFIYEIIEGLYPKEELVSMNRYDLFDNGIRNLDYWRNKTMRSKLFLKKHLEVLYVKGSKDKNTKNVVCSKTDFGNYVYNRLSLLENYNKSLEFIEENYSRSYKQEKLKNELNELYYANVIRGNINEEKIIIELSRYLRKMDKAVIKKPTCGQNTWNNRMKYLNNCVVLKEEGFKYEDV